ncbi:MAG: cysteine desulfurase [Chloroflexi bacterium]|nr:MAG: cysteine desulfurase [Chloroflexota bacterium]
MTGHNIYLDHSATTPTDPRVVEAMLPYFSEIYGNPSSAHSFGRRAEAAIETARETVAHIFNCKPSEIVFTSGGSEGDNLAIRGAAWSARETQNRNHLITSPIEHSAVVKTIEQLATVMGFSADYVSVDRHAVVSSASLQELCQEETALVSIMYANNEVGTVQPLAELAAVAHEHGALFHTDAVQAAGQLTLDVQQLGVDLMSISAHKFYGPKGVGALYIRESVDLISSQTGGSHESGRRAGTHNTPFIVGLAKALEIAYEEREQHIAHYRHMRDMLVEGILARVSDAIYTGHPQNRIPSHASFLFLGVDSSKLIMHLDMRGVAASGGSACKTGNPEPSATLLAMGYPPEEAIGTLRLTVGRQTTEKDVAYAIDVVAQTVEKLRKLERELGR